MSVLLLCRHVETGDTTHAERLAGALAPLDLAAIYTSPLARAVETAKAVAVQHDRRPIEVDGLREIDFGDVNGLAFDAYPAELQAALLEAPGSARLPGGESYAELQARVCTALEEILAAHRDETIAVITHAGPIRAALANWLAIPADASFRLDQRYGAVNVVEFTDGIPFVRLVNGSRPSG
jgi:broad specificity phosphatase PhoE